MICKHCGSECPDGNIFCEVCGKELDPAVLPENIDSKGRINNEKPEKKKKTQREKYISPKVRKLPELKR